MAARIFQRPKNAMQSGGGASDSWVLVYEPASYQRPNSQAGWAGSSNTNTQLRLTFATKEEAIAYAERENIAFTLEIPPTPKAITPKVYSDNFRYGRPENWTH